MNTKREIEPGAKVVLADAEFTHMATVPKLVPGRVYCVSKTVCVWSQVFQRFCWRVHLCGVRLVKRMPEPSYGMPLAAFRRID